MGYFENIISQKISKVSGIDSEELMQYIEIPPNADMGDFAFPCFKLAKVMRKSPMAIAEELKLKLDEDLGSEIDKLEIVNGYLNFYINRVAKVKYVFNQIEEKKDTYGSNNSGNGKNVIVEYSSPNIAKPFHIGHLRNTIIGNSLYNIYKFMGYNTISINHLGDYGTQFGKLIEGIKRWEKEYNIAENPIEELSKIYIRINELCKEDESVLDACRENFRLLENGDSYCVSLWEKIKTLSIEEFDKIYDLLNVKFDKVLGESFYVDKIDDVVYDLKQANVLVESQGAMIIDMEDKGLGVLIVIKSNESSIYATRDLAAIKFRAQTFDFDKCLYVVGSEQNTYFKQLFEAAKYLNISEKCKENLYHVQYGMVRLPSGKMSTRLGNTITVKQLLDETINRVDKIIEEKNPDMENREEQAKRIGIGAIVFNNVSTSIIKDQIFDWDIMLNFSGETGPYIQYIYVRTKSVLEKINFDIPKLEEIDYNVLVDDYSMRIIQILYQFESTLEQVISKNEPSFLAKYLINLSQAFSDFYNNNKIVTDDKKVQDARILITYYVGMVLKNGAKLLGMEMPDKM